MMKFVVASVFLLQLVWSAPAQKACEDVFSYNICAEYERAGEEGSLAYGFPPPPGGEGGEGGLEKELLEKLLLEKLNFLTNIGLLKRIPILGELVHNMVENDPEGVSKALSGGIFALVDLGLKIIAGGIIGR